MRFNSVFWFSALALSGFGRTARAHEPVDGDIRAMLGAYYYHTDTMDHGFNSPWYFAPGLIVEGDLNNHGGFEIGIFYLQDPFSVANNGKVLTERLKRVVVDAGYRYWFTSKFSLGLAFSSSYSIGDPDVMHDDFGTGEHPGISTQDTTEYGFDASVEYEPWHAGRMALVIDGRYNYSVTAKKREDSNYLGGFIGLKYFVQAREKNVSDEE